MAPPDQEYDFIVVGAGTAGCYIASALARSKAAPRVLLVEAGGDNSDPEWHHHRNMTQQLSNVPQNWGYKSVPLESANNRQVSIDRGKGLGGSSAINFTYWTRGSSDEWDEMARLVGEDEWKWENTEKRYKRLENYHDTLGPGGGNRYYDVPRGAYGQGGPICICSPTTNWDVDLEASSGVWEKCGYPINGDMSAGNPLGVVMSPLSGNAGLRTTSAANLRNPPTNLHVVTDAPVHKVLFIDGKASGIQLIDGKSIQAAKEVIVSAGAVDSPKLLLLSGIGPSDSLSRLDVPLVHHNGAVGRNLKDHYHSTLLYSTEAAPPGASALDTGGHTLGFFKLDTLLAGPDFAALPAPARAHLALPTVPTFEMAHRGGRAAPVSDVHRLDNEAPDTAAQAAPPPMAYMVLFVLTGQGAGSVALASADPAAPPLIRPSYLEHPWDRRVAVEATRAGLRVVGHPAAEKLSREGVFEVLPASDSEEDILDFWRKNVASTWHMTSSCRMGREQGEDEAVVDPAFKVFGVQGLRVADASVLPLLPTVHTQAHAYQMGMLAAEKIVKEHGLDA